MTVARIFCPDLRNCVYSVNCTKFGQLILRIIIKIDATRCQIFRLKCTKIVFGGKGKGGHPQYFIAPPPQFQFSRNMLIGRMQALRMPRVRLLSVLVR